MYELIIGFLTRVSQGVAKKSAGHDTERGRWGHVVDTLAAGRWRHMVHAAAGRHMGECPSAARTLPARHMWSSTSSGPDVARGTQ